jgi:hypothetical protein
MNVPNLNDLQRRIIAAITLEQEVIAARCGWGSGKTAALIFALWTIAKLRPGTSSLLITDTTPRYNSVLKPEIEKWLAPIGWTYNHTNKIWLDTHTNSTVFCRSYFRPGTREATHNPLEGLNITSGVVLIDECQTLTIEVANKALGRLRSGPSPIMILVGLPVVGAWWCKLAEDAGYSPLFYSSYVNEANLSSKWFEATKLLPEEERLAMVMNKPRPPTGLVYSEFNYEKHVIDDFVYHEAMTGRIAIDWGFRKPSVLIIVYDESRKASVIIHEFNPQEVTIEGLSQMILSIAYPRSLMANALGKKIWLDSGVADKAGRARSDQTGLSAFKLIRRSPEDGGIGIPLRSTTDPVRTDILNGVQRLKRAFYSNKYLITREVWNKGEKSLGNSIRKAILSYGWDNKEQPKKDGREDPLDALRYDCIVHHWSDSARSYSKERGTAPVLTKSKRRKLSF